MITTLIILTWFGSAERVSIDTSKITFIAPITGVANPGCALLVSGVENDINVSESCDEVKKLLK